MKLSAKTQFRIGTACILLLFGGGVSFFEYLSLKNSASRSVYKDTEIYIAAAEATRIYIKDVARPRVSQALAPETFIPEVMSTSFVGREIMNRIRDRFPEFRYKRAANNPRNPVNQADGFERDMLQWFADHPDKSEWSGVIKNNGIPYYARLNAIYAETECLACHGKIQEAPKGLRDIYAAGGGYDFRVGEVVAADSIYIPVDVTFVRIKEKALSVFIVGIGSLLLLFGLFYLLFNRTVVSQLEGLLATFKSISGKDARFHENISFEPADEIEQLKKAFEDVAAHLKQAHEELTASESKYRHLFEASQDAIFISDMDTRITDINEACIRLFDFKDLSEAVSIESFYQMFWDARDAASLFETIRQKGFVKNHEVSMVNCSGNRLTALISASLHRDEHNRPCGIDWVLRDMTDKKRLDNYLARTEKLASIGHLAAGVAHEINNPLGVINCYANLIRKSVAPNSQEFQDIRIIQKHTRQCKSVVESLLNFARVSEPEKIPSDMHACIEEILAVLAHQMQKEKIVVQREFMRSAPLITLDPQKMRQVFMNFFMNAMQAMPEGGKITVKTLLQETDKIFVIKISDTGCGISEKNINRIFEPFFTTKETIKGTGLGLAVNYGIIKQHGGEIEVESTPGKGSTFTILLPTSNPNDIKAGRHE